ncbi:hypothetical protein [Actinoplanes sp. CA-252034]|uniref:hypothetical protein n=1 Tax=Actinoplanes sp. CA-252034 TaxID=3239906 RepID=UPI003D996B48
MISVQEFARRLTEVSPTAVSSDDIEDLADTTGVRIDPARGIDAGQAQQLLDHISPPVPITAAAIVAPDWAPLAAGRPAAPPMVFSNPGAVDAPNEQSAQQRRSAPRRTGRPGSRRPGS